MTREHKLALIVGFSLILLVGVLISDHLSRASRAKIAPVAPGETMVADTRIVDPTRLDGNSPMPEQAPVQIASMEPVTPAVPVGGGQLPVAPGTAPVAGPDTARIANAGSNAAPATQPRPQSGGAMSLEEAIRANGGSIRHVNGNPVFDVPSTFPPAADIARIDPPNQPRSTIGPAPTPSVTIAPPPIPTYTIKNGDTLIKLAERTYGSGRLWQNLAQYNRINESSLRIGQKIQLPPRDILVGRPDARITNTPPAPAPARNTPGARPAPAPTRTVDIRYATYTVRAGDTLGHISQKMLGTSKRVQDILDLNKLDDEDTISIGTILKMPTRG